jgi:UDP-N-acetylglucosamine--N-acetylmuramyl-(pentapeptide) pyrophosphoryl-undecaprenol N-acetylglucosamine transferase
VRKSIAGSALSREEALQYFGLDPKKTTVLAMGGSLGARSINQVIARHIEELRSLGLQLIWQTGKATARQYIDRGKNYSAVWVNEFIQDMDKAYAAADLAVSRAGAMSVAELCVTGKPTVFVPYPFAAEDHQTVNAKYLVDRHAAMMVKDSETGTKLFSAITTLAKDKELRNRFKKNIAAFAVTDADERIANEILKQL